MPRLSSEAQKMIQNYGSYFIQFSKFTCLRVRGFEDEPMKLPRYALDYFILAKVCRQLFLVINNNLPQENWESVFPIKFGSLNYSSMINASAIGCNFLGFGFGSSSRSHILCRRCHSFLLLEFDTLPATGDEA